MKLSLIAFSHLEPGMIYAIETDPELWPDDGSIYLYRLLKEPVERLNDYGMQACDEHYEGWDIALNEPYDGPWEDTQPPNRLVAVIGVNRHGLD